MLIEVAVTLLAPIVLGFFAGLYIDKYFATVPLFTAIFLIVGVFTGFYMLYKKYV